MVPMLDFPGHGVTTFGTLFGDDVNVHVAVIGQLDGANPGRPTPAGNLGLGHVDKRTL